MFISFLREYNQWKKDHRMEVQQAKLRKEAIKSPLNYQILDQMFQLWTKEKNLDAVMEVEGKDFKFKCYWDTSNTFQRITEAK